ncbi:ArsR/SmtB family transcription factor [Ethanoligenens harbinense]|uniref:Transcriptional regulator, ArsR family n=1 Tax=Ethanoligenens harbinense (strain DSM 18485 / JCM 12961 / CGMCC 1.5033 / YUAN-3) TaxID=663278 RepID=E6U3W0_ETHHY|nr:metalloregulator ArsR/SmtB family transcription factor [Ethanoligenens harbinense]ADU26527.1 transcriptional regulator, ArsR family [Ethanoligenens harbinense YUAN-3]AVQ95655.1 transcriptional regulator [Ethanoligenens harbinense YUAN-3]AYF38318.1 transcriptional regulator [Ethanoligenens harbinense]AYF41062.1 transcriptional regulator [Ethanoligenens harbinense]QCN91894.1 transcriptional regulator [Ethanoligenens harbinense]
MENNYADVALLFKALSDETRLKIIDRLSCGELCACDILKHLNITQPTLSYHMKMLSECGIVNANRQGAWMHYTLNVETMKQIADYWSRITSDKSDYICYQCCDDSEETCKCAK